MQITLRTAALRAARTPVPRVLPRTRALTTAITSAEVHQHENKRERSAESDALRFRVPGSFHGAYTN